VGDDAWLVRRNTMDPLPAPAKEVLALIRVTETSRDDDTAYDTVYGHHEGDLPEPITDLTVAELQFHQPDFSETFGSSASGAYQIMRATLEDLLEGGHCDAEELFDKDCQDDLGFALLQRRGYDDWATFVTTTDEFMVGLAQEWASFPVPFDMQGAHRWVTRGQSYYAGDGVNQALATPEEVWTICEKARAEIPRAPRHQRPERDLIPIAKPEVRRKAEEWR
jgi:hypothetical protein